jgi:hypothetical protein
MYITGRDPLIQNEYRAERLRQAEAWYILRTDAKRSNLPTGIYRGMMLRLGLWLELTGCRIKARYAAPKPQPIFPGAQESGLQGC